MPFNHKHKILFIHIPKTAGSSIELFFHMQQPNLFYTNNCIKRDGVTYSKQHLTIPLLKEYLDDGIFDNYFKFAFVRNPYDRVVSDYYWVNRDKECIPPFNDWVFNRYKKIDCDHKLPQHGFVYENGKCVIDYVGRFETLTEDFKTLLSMLNLDTTLKLPHEHKTQKPHGYPRMDSETLDIIYNTYRRDFELFGYDKRTFSYNT